MSDQADQLRKLVRDTVRQHPSLAPGVPLVVLSSGKGGVGVSTVARELARELAALGKRSVLVDGNPLQPDITTQLGLDVHGSLADVLDGSRSAVEVLRPIGESIQLLPGRWAADTPPQLNRAALQRLLTELRTLHTQADLVLIDAGSGMSPWAQQLWRAAQQILLISTPDSVAVMDSYAAVKHSPWGDVDGKIRLVLNQCDAPAAGRATGQRFEATCQRFLGIRVVAPAVLATRSDIVATVTLPLDPDRAFRQSIRLLAADVMSDSLAMLGKASQKTSQETDAAPLKNRGAEKSLQNLQ